MNVPARIEPDCRELWDIVGDGLIMIDHQGMIRSVNRSGREMLGAPEQLENTDLAAWFMPRLKIDRLLAGAERTRSSVPSTVATAVLTGEELIVLAPDIDLPGAYRAVILKSLQRAVTNFDRTINFATRDPVTRCLNRETFEELIEQAMAGEEEIGLACIDLDQFSLVNETHGYAEGDTLLRITARRLQEAIPGSELARISGGRFALLVRGADTLSRMRGLVAAIRRALLAPVSVGGMAHGLSATIGVALWPNAGKGISLMSAAELAVRSARAAGGGTQWFTPALLAEHRDRMELEHELREAIEGEALELHYQPKVRLSDRRAVGFEALARWTHPRRGAVPPAQFIPLAERTGLILPLGNWVIREACRQLSEWREEGLALLPIAVNVSPHQLLAQPIADLLAPLAEFSIPSELIDIEITESAMMDNLSGTQSIVEELRKANISIAIDDFGTGHSSLGNLRRLPINQFKIDRCFVEDIDVSREARDIIATIVAMARALSFDVVAEGVETESQADFIARSGVEIIQGYLISRPLPGREAKRFLP